jgi:hypothetical protein
VNVYICTVWFVENKIKERKERKEEEEEIL